MFYPTADRHPASLLKRVIKFALKIMPAVRFCNIFNLSIFVVLVFPQVLGP